MSLQRKLNTLSVVVVLTMTLLVLVVGNGFLKSLIEEYSVGVLQLELKEYSRQVGFKLNSSGLKGTLEHLDYLESQVPKNFETREYFVIDRLSGRFVVTRGRLVEGTLAIGGFEKLLDLVSDTSDVKTFYGKQKIYSGITIPSIDWLVVATVSRMELVQRRGEFLFYLTLAAGVVIALSAFMFRRFSKLLVARLENIDREVALIESGQRPQGMTVEDVHDEVDRLQFGVECMGARIHERTLAMQRASHEIEALNESLLSQNRNLKKMGERLELAADVGQIGVWEWDVQKDVLIWDKHMQEIYGVEGMPESLHFSRWFDYVHPQDRAHALELMEKSLDDGMPFSSTFRITRDGEIRHVRTAGRVFYDDEGAPLRVVGVNQDITGEVEKEEHVHHLAYHDPLTGLSNREFFFQIMSEKLYRASRYRTGFALCFLDLDGFKGVNDVLGHDAGDSLLVEMARRLESQLRNTDSVARVGGDEFVFILDDIQSPRDCGAKLKEILVSIAQPMELKGQSVQLNASVGVAFYPEDGSETLTLMKHADTAMYAAKRDGKNTYRFFQHRMMEEASRRLRMEMDVRCAIDQQQLYLVYQPKLELPKRRPVAVEALIRWNHPQRGEVLPGEFIPIAESCSLILELGDWVLNQALRQLQLWRDHPVMKDVSIAVNLSSKQLHQPRFDEHVMQLLDDYSVDGKLLELEITETAMMEHEDIVLPVLERLREQGVKISIDDFGKGHSSLSYLKCLPVDTLKIDRLFVKDLSRDTGDQQILAAVVTLGQALNKTVVAEGVETAEQLEIINSANCDMAQGYYLAVPMKVGELETWWGQPAAPLARKTTL